MSDQELISKIERAISKAALDGTLTQSALDEFHKIVESNKELKRELVEVKTKFAKLDEKHREYVEQCANLSGQVADWAKRESELEEREKEMTRLELEAQYDRERVSDHKQMFELIFRNIEVRRNIMTAVPGLKANDSYGAPQTPYVDERTQTEKSE